MPLTIPQVLPPSDLLEQVQGIEEGLLRRRRLQWLGLLLAAVQITVLLLNSAWLDALLHSDWHAVADKWWLIVPLFVLVLSVLLVGWTRFWLDESKRPFRYTFSISSFNPVTEGDEDALMRPLQTDLLEKLSRRVGRLSRLMDNDTQAGGEGAETKSEQSGPQSIGSSHIHVSGYYAKRRRRPDPCWALEVTAWVRVGDPSQAATLAPPVKYSIRSAQDNEAPLLTSQQYEEVLERAYSSVATAIYSQIQQDVAKKIDLLPSRYFRAAAYYYEAEDYARSNTLDAYDRALELFDAALNVYDPNWRLSSGAEVRRPLRKVRQMLALAFQRLRGASSHVVARAGKSEVLAARAQIGYANTLLSRRILAELAGRGVNPMFEAWPTADRAVKRMTALADDVPGRQEALFDAYVARALASTWLNRDDNAERDLALARARSPSRAERDPRLLFVSGLLEVEVLTALPRLRRAVEFDPQFEAAQFKLASNLEMLWRLRPGLEENVAEMVFEEYESVVRLNPGNVSAWANLGYMHWMLAGFEQPSGANRMKHMQLARDSFESGRQYKEIKRDAFVGELDHGLARLAAEAGRFRDAYRHYVNTVAAIMTQGRSQAHSSYRDYQLSLISDKILERFKDYRDAVERAWKKPTAKERATTTKRVRDSVYAFALNDFAEASYQYYLRSGDLDALEAAHHALLVAIEQLESNYILAYLNMADVEREMSQAFRFFAADDDPGGKYLDHVDRNEPSWAEGNLITLVRCTELSISAKRQADALGEQAKELRHQSREARHEAPSVAISPWSPDSGMSMTTAADSVVEHAQDAAGQARPDALDDYASELERQAEELTRVAGEREQHARRLTLSLLPHEWLWRSSRGGSDDPDSIPEAELDPRALTRRDYKRELKWERSLDDFHVRALVSWCDRKLLADNDRHGSVERVLDLIEERFAPGDPQILMKRRAKPNGAPPPPRRGISLRRPSGLSQEERERTIRKIILRYHQGDRYAYQTLAALTDPSIREDERKDFYREAVAKPGRPATLYRWLGDRLREAGDVDTAVAAYEQAAKTSHALTLFEVSQRFDALEMQDAALRCLRRAAAAESADASVLVSVASALSRLGAVDDAVRCLGRARATDDPAVLADVAEAYESAGAWDKSESTYRLAAKLDGKSAYPLHSDGYYRNGIGRSLWHLGRAREAVSELVHVSGSGGVWRWRSALVDELVAAGLSRSDYLHLLTLLLGEQRIERQPDDVADAAAALLSLARSVDGALPGSAAASGEDIDVPVRRPIVLVADEPRFFKQLGETPAVKRMIETDIPAIQDRMREKRGVHMPGVRIRGAHDLAQREYRLAIHEVPLERGRVPRGTDDPHGYMLDRLEKLVGANLAAFVDAESVERLLQDWVSGDGYAEHADLRARVLSSNDAFRRFVQLIEALVREAVPVTDIGTILRQFDGRDLAAIPLHSAVDDVRLALRESLPGLDGRPIVALPDPVELALAEALTRNGGAAVALEPAELERLRGIVRKAAAKQRSKPFAFRVNDASLRFFANRLVEMDLPDVAVLSERATERNRPLGFKTPTGERRSRSA